MPVNCAIYGCSSKGYKTGRTFSSFPMLNKQTERSLALTKARQIAWIKAINREDFFASNYPYARVCDLHFIIGKAAKYTDVDNPDWVPTLRVGYGECPSLVEVEVETCEMEIESSVEVDVDIFDQQKNNKETQTYISTSHVGTQTDGTVTGMSADIIISYVDQIKMLEEMLVIHNVTLDNYRENDVKTKFFTGQSRFATLEALFDLIEPKIADSKKLTKFQILIIVLSRLRLNLSFRYLSYQFNVSLPTVSRHFYKCLSVLYRHLGKFVYWPEPDEI